MSVQDLSLHDLIRQIVDGTGDRSKEALYRDRIAALKEVRNRSHAYRPPDGAWDPNSEEFAVARAAGALACYDFRECPPEELRAVLRWAVNRFELNLVLWYDDAPVSDEQGEDE